MSQSVPIKVAVEIRVESGPASGQKRFRLSQSIELPPLIHFKEDLPTSGECRGWLRFVIPDGPEIRSAAILRYDPASPEKGSCAHLIDLPPEADSAIEKYISQQRMG